MDEKYQFVVKEWHNIDRHIQIFNWLYSLPLSVCLLSIQMVIPQSTNPFNMQTLEGLNCFEKYADP